jgi:pimeloyl-ACP methyl ester carboxylesterase
MQSFNSEGVELAYVEEGEGDPILLIHGFASNIAANWRDAGWIRTLTEAGRRVIALDNRGHGHSEKLYDPSLYGAPAMAEDARRLLDHLGIARADVMGYSMGPASPRFCCLRIRSGCAARSSPASASIWCAAWSARGRSPKRWKLPASRT